MDARAQGVLVVNKPRGPTSHDLVAGARRFFRTREVGHAGTLDPMASGVLLLLVGEATKLSQWLTGDSKSYRATVLFGRSTDTLDALGTTLEQRDLEPGWLAPEALQSALDAELTRTLQVPPAFSAVQVGGQRAHRAARAGVPLELAPRPVRLEQLKVVGLSDTELQVELRVSKGYYVRSFARDLGLSLGAPAHLSALVRVASGPFCLDESVTWPPKDGTVPIPTDEAARRALPSLTLTADGLRRARFGQLLGREDFLEDPVPVHSQAHLDDTAVAWFDGGGRLIALGHCETDGFRVVRGFAP